MSGGTSRQLNTRAQVENDLLEVLRQREVEWIQASTQDRDTARQQFKDALDLFNSVVIYGVVIYGKIPRA